MKEITLAKDTLFALMRSHDKLAHAEYIRNPAFNNTHHAHIIQEKLLKELDADILQEYFKEAK